MSGDTARHCVVPGCDYNPESNRGIPDDDTVKFFDFPEKPGTRFQGVKWIEFVRIGMGRDPDDTSWTPKRGDKICSNHFVRNCWSENARKSNFCPTVYPGCLKGLPPRIKYDLKDLVCWWIKEGEQRFPRFTSIVETRGEATQTQENLNSFTLVQVDVTSEPHPYVNAYVKVNEDLTFKSCLRNKRVPTHLIIGERETNDQIGSVYEFKTILERLQNLNLCVGTRTEGVKRFPPRMNGKVVTLLVDGEEVERLVSNECEGVAGNKVCGACEKLWCGVFNYRRRLGDDGDDAVEETKKEKLERTVEETMEEKLERLERTVENYKVEVCKLVGRNEELWARLHRGNFGKGGGLKRRKIDLVSEHVVDNTNVASTPPKVIQTEARPQNRSPSNHRKSQPKRQQKTTQNKRFPAPTKSQQSSLEKPPNNPPQSKPKVLRITREQAELIRQVALPNTSGNVIRVQASQLASVTKILHGCQSGNPIPQQSTSTFM